MKTLTYLTLLTFLSSCFRYIPNETSTSSLEKALAFSDNRLEFCKTLSSGFKLKTSEMYMTHLPEFLYEYANCLETGTAYLEPDRIKSLELYSYSAMCGYQKAKDKLIALNQTLPSEIGYREGVDFFPTILSNEDYTYKKCGLRQEATLPFIILSSPFLLVGGIVVLAVMIPAWIVIGIIEGKA